jgi:hypothetical protein
MKSNLLIFGTRNFNNSLDEVKEDLGFSLIYFDQEKIVNSLHTSISAAIVDSQICEDKTVSSTINKISDKPVLLLENKNYPSKCRHDVKDSLPVNLLELKSKINNLIIGYKFNTNSSITIKSFTLDKNEKKLKKDNKFIIITEREVQLIELLFFEKKPLSKNIILTKIWKYADDADTHTVETHIYRLRKKIMDMFQYENFIVNSKSGYSL